MATLSDMPLRERHQTAFSNALLTLHMDAAFAEFSSVKLRPTPARVAVLSVLQGSHPKGITADIVFQHLDANGIQFNLPAVYLALRELVHCGLAVRSDTARTKSLFFCARPRVDAHRRAQMHQAVCRRCGLSVPLGDGAWLASVRELAEKSGLRIAAEPIDLQVTCSGCDPSPA